MRPILSIFEEPTTIYMTSCTFEKNSYQHMGSFIIKTIIKVIKTHQKYHNMLNDSDVCKNYIHSAYLLFFSLNA